MFSYRSRQPPRKANFDDSRRCKYGQSLISTLKQRLLYFCENAGSPTAPALGGAPAMDPPAMLCAQPARSRRCKQKDAERDLGFEQQGICRRFCCFSFSRLSLVDHDHNCLVLATDLRNECVVKIKPNHQPRPR